VASVFSDSGVDRLAAANTKLHCVELKRSICGLMNCRS
jgi:hypothetical protein